MNDFLQNLRNGQAEKQRTAKTRKNYDNSYHYSTTPRFNTYGGYPNTRSQNPNMKRPPAQPAAGPFAPEDASMVDILAESIENLSIHIETLAKNQEFLIIAQDRAADMLERQANAIEEIVRFLHVHENPSDEPGAEEQILQEESTQTADIKCREMEDIEEIRDDSDLFQNRDFERRSKPARILKKSKKSGITRKIDVCATASSAGSPERKGLLSRERVMGIINDMRKEGATFDEVAKHLISLGQPTFSGRGEWHAQTIHRLCNKKK